MFHVEHTLETIVYCPSCSGSKFSPFIACRDYTCTQALFTIQECASCGLRFTNPRPSEANISQYYDNPNYVSHTDTSTGVLYRAYQTVKAFALRDKAQFVNTLSEGRNILDYGAGTGDFAGVMKEAGWNSFAYEPNTAAGVRITEKHPNVNKVDSLASIANETMHVITLWHVLEHVHRLDETLHHFNRILEKDGSLIIAVPNCNSFDAKFYKEFWAAYDVPRHIYHFQPNTIASLLLKHGFSCQAIKPMWFDSFYVSLLSESYLAKNSSIFSKTISSVRALIIGLISNIYTIRKTQSCSSITYTFVKAK